MFTAEHLHLALNHAPIAGVPLAGAVIAWGLIRRNDGTVRTGLAILAGCAALTVAVMRTGEIAAANYLGADFLDSVGFRLMHEHERQAEKAALATYAAGALALASLATGFFRPKVGRCLAAVAVLGVAAGTALSVITAESGGKIRRADFRPPVEKESFGTLKQGMAADFKALCDNVGEESLRGDNRARVKALLEKSALCASHTPAAAQVIEPESTRREFIAAYKAHLGVFDDTLRRADRALAENDTQGAMAAVEECKALLREGHRLFMKR